MNDEKRVLADMPELLTLAPSPHVRRGVTTRHLMVDVLLALPQRRDMQGDDVEAVV